MRFFADGPNIPDELLEERDNGNVVFFCGAGISRPAGLPDFLTLTEQVVHKLGMPGDAKSRALWERVEQELEQDSPNLDFVPPLDQMFNLLQQEYGAGYIDDLVCQLLKTPIRAKVEQHKLILRLSRNAAHRPQLVTTNFDLLFERADRSLKRHVPPALPDLASGQPLEGLVYLHGRWSKPAKDGVLSRKGMVISSSDFGRAYLADGWATRFVRDLLQNYVIVLIGYTANDPPVRYLLEGLHARGSDRSARIYAFDQGTDNEVEGRWRNRGVRSLAYPQSSAHAALWESLRAWAEWADDPDAWRRSIVEMAQLGPRNLQPYQRGQVASLVRTTVGAKFFADAEPAPPAEWLCVFDRNMRYAEKKTRGHSEFDPQACFGLDEDPPRPQKTGVRTEAVGEDFLSPFSHDERMDGHVRLAGVGGRWANPLSPRLFQLARWFGKVLNDPRAAWWAAGYPALHPDLLNQVEWQLENSSASMEPLAHRIWGLLIEKFRYSPADEHDDGWYSLIRKLNTGGWNASFLRRFERVVQPYLKPKRPWSSCLPDGGYTSLRLREVVDFEVGFPTRDSDKPTIPSDRLPDVFRALRRGLELGASLLEEIDTDYWTTKTLAPEVGVDERSHDAVDIYLQWVAVLFDRLAIECPDYTRAEVQSWPANEPFFFNKLKIYAWKNSGLFSGLDAANGLLALPDEGFWESNHQRELLHTLRERWGDFSLSDRSKIEARIISGPPPWEGQEEADYQVSKALRSATILGWLEQQGCSLSDGALKVLPALRAVDTRWNPLWDTSADDSHEGGGGWVRTESDPSRIIDAPLSEVVQLVKEGSGHSYTDLTDYRPFQGLVEQRPLRAVAVLSYEARCGRYPQELWRTAISNWPEGKQERLRWLFAWRIVRLPTEVVGELHHPISYWFKKNLPALAYISLNNALSLWDKIVDHLYRAGVDAARSSMGDVSIGGVQQHRSRRTYEHAINSPFGHMAEALFSILDGLKLKADAGIPREFQARMERLLEAPGEGRDHVASEMAIRHRWLYYLDRAWVSSWLVPMFQAENALAESAWNGFLHSNQLPGPEFFSFLKPNFLNVFRCMPTWCWSDSPARRLSEFLIIACYWGTKGGGYLSFDEGRAALQHLDHEGRASAAWCLVNIVKEQRCWRSFGKPFLQRAWPREARFQSAATSRHFASMAEGAGGHFPDVVKTVLPFLSPVEHLDSLIHQLNKEQGEEEDNLAEKFPEPMLALLDRLIPDDPRSAPYGLMSALNLIAEAAPKLRQDARWRRLNHLVSFR